MTAGRPYQQSRILSFGSVSKRDLISQNLPANTFQLTAPVPLLALWATPQPQVHQLKIFKGITILGLKILENQQLKAKSNE